MIEIGRVNTLYALRETSVGVFLGDDEGNDVLLPNKYVPSTLELDDEIDVFIYTDSEDRIIATTLKPYIQRDEFAYLTVVSITSFGAFLDWGLEKDLLVPLKEQSRPMAKGQSYVVFLYLDETTNRLVASSRINSFLLDEAEDLQVGDEVDLMAYEYTDLGVNVIVNNEFRGLLYNNELFKKVFIGDRMKGYVKNIRDDYRIDVSLQKPGYANVEPNAQLILDKLTANDGFLPLNDNSAPDRIYRMLEMSKKTFKKAIGALYKDRKITIEDDGIRLL